LIVIEDPSHGRAVIQHHIPLGIDHGGRPAPRRTRHAGGFSSLEREILLGLGLPPPEHLLFDRPQAAHPPPHLDLGMAVGFQDGLGQVAQEVHRPNAIGALRTTVVIPFRSTTRRFIPHLSNRSWPEGQ
jgi:hypothetical protein